ncbi:MAG: DUF47 family protein [Chloroflexi bacterium]|nr:DUF47 family protein [Chloroflexota bacterium]
MVRLRLLPRDEEFFDMFERSAKNVREGAKRLLDMIERYDDPQRKFELVAESEHQGDEITHQIARKLSRTFITPLDREDIRALSSALDDIVDFAEGAAETMVLCKIDQPTPYALEMARNLVAAVDEVVVVVSYLRELKDPAEHIIAIHALENKGDSLWREGFANLFENNVHPLTAMKWKEIYEQLEEAMDACEKVADIVEETVLKHA